MRQRRDDAPTLIEARRDEELGVLPRRRVSEYAVYGDVDPPVLALALRVEATEGFEDAGEWPPDVAARWHDPESRSTLPWIDRWATVDGHRVSALWAGGQCLVVPRDADPADLEDLVEALRSGADLDYPWPSS